MAEEINQRGQISVGVIMEPLDLTKENSCSAKPVPSFDSEQKSKDSLNKESELLYALEDVPPWYTCLLLGFQHYLTMAGTTLALPVAISSLLCIKARDPTRAAMISTVTFIGGFNTILQTTFGIRLPIVQGSSSMYIVPTVAMLSSYFGECPDFSDTDVTDAEYEEAWKTRMMEVCGNIAVASLLQIFLGWTGIIGVLLRWITPLTIAPTIGLIGLSLVDLGSGMSSQNWPVAATTIVLISIFTQYLQNITIRLPKRKRITINVQNFRLFSVLITVLISWMICYILTTFDILPEGDKARTDFNLDILYDAPWFYIPYPGQFGTPTVSLAGVIGIFAAVIASTFESIGDYHACARITGAPPPPASAVNRGIFMEGVATMLASLSGTAIGCTSYAQNIGAIAITKVGSRRVVQYSGLIMMFFGLMGKVAGVFVMIPEPIVGGLLCIMFSIIVGMSVSSLRQVNMSSSRNIFVLGSSLYFGTMIPKWIDAHEGVVNTGSLLADQTLVILLKTPMFIGGAIGFFLDNTIPGNRKDRGLLARSDALNKAKDDGSSKHSEGMYDAYNLPFGMDVIRRHKWMRHLPISPTFKGFKIQINKAKAPGEDSLKE